MATISEALAIAIQHHQAGRLQAAEQIYRLILQAEPNHPDALHLLGVAAYQVGKHEVAVEYIERAIGLKRTEAEYHNNLAGAYYALHRIPEAAACYRRALELKPDLAEARYNLGNVLKDQGKLEEAVAHYRRTLELRPDHAAAHGNLGVALNEQGKVDEAVACYRRALELKPDLAQAHSNLGNALKEQGKLDEALACHRRALELKPDLAEVHGNLGNVLKEQGKLDEAVACYRRALELKPDYAEAHDNLGTAFKDQGKLDEAVTCYRRALAVKPDFAEAYNNLGVAVKDQEKLDEAVACYHRALELKPEYAEAHNNLGNALKDAGKLDEAVACYHRALGLKSDFAEAHSNLGNALKDQGMLDEAVACCRRALELKPDYAPAHNNLGNVLKDQGKLDEAVACYRRALELKPTFAEAHSNLGNTLNDQGKLDEAVACCRRALELKPDFAVAYDNLAVALKDQGKLDERVACYRRALELKPDFADAHNNLGNALKDQGRLDEAVACYRRALELKPDYAASLGSLAHSLQHLCCWEDLKVLSPRVIEAVNRDADGSSAPPVPPFAFLALTTAEQQLRCARQWVDRKLKALSGPGRNLARSPASDRKPRITIGYLSADFHAHATAYLIAELFEKHDRDRFDLFGYSYGPDDGSPMRRRLIQAFDRFSDLKGASFMESARRIAADGVDILVDLKGYTTDARTQILALRPAPIQVNYLGYPGTMGAPFMDYILVDEFAVPGDQQPFFTERLVHLPGCYQVNDSQREISAHTPSRAECGLPEKGFVFCSFNNSYKITAEMFDVWMALLKAVPESVLWLLEGNRFVPANLRREAEARGVAAERLVFAPRMPLPEHLARHRLADLFLDTFPVNAHTTASDALWAGCPVLTLAGKTFISRVAGSLLTAIGLPELVTTSLEDYQALALRLARDAEPLTGLRARLEANRKTSRLFDAGRFARSIEEAYRTMWEIYVSGQQPRAFTVGPN
jgi:predicted O-linked N-acetylglucosamine transferase (SPINDLY family)